MSKRELLSAEEYDKQIKAFQARVTQLQQDIQKKDKLLIMHIKKPSQIFVLRPCQSLLKLPET